MAQALPTARPMPPQCLTQAFGAHVSRDIVYPTKAPHILICKTEKGLQCADDLHQREFLLFSSQL